nr:uncharacterized protein CTRU02_13851 [Colletotrichum truncatum]KAF6782853.1 hypothetical protein CTRU02_13851 [Colletotrichum truncatum]
MWAPSGPRLGWSRHFGARDLSAVHEAVEWINATVLLTPGRPSSRDAPAAACISPNDQSSRVLGRRETSMGKYKSSILGEVNWELGTPSGGPNTHHSGFWSESEDDDSNSDDNKHGRPAGSSSSRRCQTRREGGSGSEALLNRAVFHFIEASLKTVNQT